MQRNDDGCNQVPAATTHEAEDDDGCGEVPAGSTHDAGGEGTATALSEPPPPRVKPIPEIDSMDAYLQNYGKILGKKAIDALAPLHVPRRDPLPDFDDLLREPFPCQQHVIAAAVKMLNAVGSGFIVGEMGTGKTLLGMTAAHKHAQQPRNRGGYGGRYRAIVLCPDHLIAKWCREITETIPAAVVTRFGPQGTEIKGGRARKGEPKNPKAETSTRRALRDAVALLGKRAGHRWEKPRGAEWYVLGRNQAKWLSDWAGLADPRRGFDGRLSEHGSAVKVRVVDQEAVLNEQGRPVYDKTGRTLTTNVLGRVACCPRCGTVARDSKGVPHGLGDLTSRRKASQKRCTGTIMRALHDPEAPHVHGLDRICPPPDHLADKKPGDAFAHAGKRWVLETCGEPLFNYTSSPYRWSIATIIQRKMRGLFRYLIIDEVHEQKSDESAQSMACGKLIGAVDHTLALTGTIIGGYAHHLFPLMMRITPASLKEEGFAWGKDLAFSEAYGRIDRVITTSENGSGDYVHGSVKSMRRSRSGGSQVKKYVRPGVMPTMFGRHMIGSSMFITLEELAEELPDLFEYVGGPLGPDASQAAWDGGFETACDMEPAQRAEYLRVQGVLEYANRELLQKGSMKLLGAYLWTTMDYPDRPWGWDHDAEVTTAHTRAVEVAKTDAEYKVPALGHTVGYWDKPGNRFIENFMGVVTPKSLTEDIVYPKEQALIDICKKQKEDGTQTWVYVQMTGKRNVQPRLKMLLEREGLKVGVLRAADVEPIDREAWIAANGRRHDVMISHPQLVSTGLDLFSKVQGGHNYSTLVFYETGYNLFTMRQAARRAWRIGQPRDCRVYYLYYKDTMQHKAMSLMSRKMAAAQALEGEFSEDGLAAMAGEDNLQMALAKNLSERIDQADMQRSWGKVKGSPRKPRPVFRPGPLDDLPIDLQMIAACLLDGRFRPVPAAGEPGRDGATIVPSTPADFAAAGLRAYGAEGEDGDGAPPELTEEVLARLFGNMIANGLWNEAS